MNSRINVDENVCNGNPRIAGTRVTVFDVISGCEEQGLNDFLEACPDIDLEDIRAAINYCSARECDADSQHCGGCTLRTVQDGIRTKNDFINRFNEVRFLESNEVIRGEGNEGIMVMPGTPEDLEANWRGINGWEVANKVAINNGWS